MNPAPPRLLLVYPNSGLDTNPTLSLLLYSLAARRVEVDVLLYQGDGFLPPNAFGDTIHLHFLPGEWFFDYQWASLKGAPGRVLRKLLFPRRYPDYAIGKDLGLFKLRKAHRYDAIIGVDPYGIILADMLNQRAGKPLVYISFEIMFLDEMQGTDDEHLKYLDLAACERTELVLIQDEERGEAYCNENNVAWDKLVFAPVSPPPQDVVKSDRLRDLLGIPADRRLVLYCGNLDTWASRDDLEELVSYWPDHFCLVLHNSAKIGGAVERYMQRLTKTGKIFVSNDPVTRDELTDLIGSADYGLAPYKPVIDRWWAGNNLYHLGLASGKVAYYALCGLPMLARTLPTFDREFAAYQCGKVYQRMSETGELLEEMDREYAHYSAESRRFYDERLNPVEGIETFVRRLLAVAGYPEDYGVA